MSFADVIFGVFVASHAFDNAERLALRWIQKYVSSFGGDPQKVTLWGESAGAISAALQMTTNGGDTEGLFRAAFMVRKQHFSLYDRKII